MNCCGKVNSIIQGWKNVIWPNAEVERIAHERIAICLKCERNKLNVCIDCGCWVPAKCRSLTEHCKYWKE